MNASFMERAPAGGCRGTDSGRTIPAGNGFRTTDVCAHVRGKARLDTPNILYEDNHLLVVVKPAGILTQADETGDESLLEQCREYIRIKYQKPGEVFMGLVHRLDRPVSGVICFARTSKAAARLCEQFRTRSLDKIYHAVVEGHMPAVEGELRHWLTNGGGTRRKTAASAEQKEGAKEGRLLYRVLEQSSRRQLLQITLLTGYKHQIRTQLSRTGCPVVGDYKYDNRKPPAKFERLLGGRAIALHAQQLILEHPTRHEELSFTAPLPPYWPVL